MKVAPISSAFRISLASWRAVPCPKKQSDGGRDALNVFRSTVRRAEIPKVDG